MRHFFENANKNKSRDGSRSQKSLRSFTSFSKKFDLNKSMNKSLLGTSEKKKMNDDLKESTPEPKKETQDDIKRNLI